MPNAQGTFRSAGGKRTVLVVDDEAINRDILGINLEDDYDVLYASDGLEALEMLGENSQIVSLILLDLLMPQMHGLEVLTRIKRDPKIQHIPVIVMTADQSAEVESLRLGAIDFIPKPYPQREVILARVKRTIELSEDRDIIQSTERDSLTRLYTREFFFHYA